MKNTSRVIQWYRPIGGFIILAIIVAVALGAWLGRAESGGGNLLSVAHRVDGSERWELGFLENYQWRPGGNLVHILANATQNVVMEANVATGGQVRGARFPNLRGSIGPGEDFGRISPDGKWMLWPASNSYQVVALDGSRVLSLPNSAARANGQFLVYIETVAWMPDGHHWLEMAQGANKQLLLRTHDVNGPEVQTWMLGKRGTYQALVGVTAKNEALYWQRQGATQTWHTVDLNQIGATPKPFTLSLPPGDSMYEVELSPQRDRLAWRMDSFHLSMRENLANVFASATRPNAQRNRTTLYVTGLDGSQPREIGHLMASWQPADGVRHVRWTPDGNQISFLYKGALYVANAGP